MSRIEQQFTSQQRFDRARKLVTVARLAMATAEAIDEANEVPPLEQLWSDGGEGLAALAHAATADVIRALDESDAERLEALAEEHGAGFVMAARQFAVWLGLCEDLT